MSQNSLKQLNCKTRDSFGSSNSRRLRKTNTIPGVVYMANGTSSAIEFLAHDLLMIRKNGLFTSTAILLNIDGKSHLAIPKSVQVHPIKEHVMHIEFIIDNGEDKILEIPIFYDNLDKSPGHKRNAFFNITQRTIKIKGKMRTAPNILHKDISDLSGGMMIKACDIELPSGYILAEKNPKKVIAVMTGRGSSKADAQAAQAPAAAKPAAKK